MTNDCVIQKGTYPIKTKKNNLHITVFELSITSEWRLRLRQVKMWLEK